jgi:hypothetical protein
MPIHSTGFETDITFLPAFFHIGDGRGTRVGVPGGDATKGSGNKGVSRGVSEVDGQGWGSSLGHLDRVDDQFV